MKCINCGGEIDGGTPFCPLCGAAQNAVGAENINNGQQPYVQSSYEQQRQSQPQQPPYGQQQQSYMQQQAYGNTSQQWQHPPYGQQQPPYGQQFNQGYAQNNMSNPIRKKSKAPHKTHNIIGAIVIILAMVGVNITARILSDFLKPLTAEKTVEKFMDAIIDGDYEKALDYLHPVMIDDEFDGSREYAIKEMKDLKPGISSYDDVGNVGKFNKNNIYDWNEYLKKYGYNDEITEGKAIYVYIKDSYINFRVVKINEKWYILYSNVFGLNI